MIAGADISVTAGHQDHASARRTRLDQDDTGAANAHGLVGQSDPPASNTSIAAPRKKPILRCRDIMLSSSI